MCVARRCNDQMHCAACGLSWDNDDPDPPECLDKKALLDKLGAETLARMKKTHDEGTHDTN